MASKSESPIHAAEPSLRMLVLGLTTLFTSPVVNTTPLEKGKAELVFSKYPIPFEDPKAVPVLELTLTPSTQGEFTNT